MAPYKFPNRKEAVSFLSSLGFEITNNALVRPSSIPDNYPRYENLKDKTPHSVCLLYHDGSLDFLNSDEPVIAEYHEIIKKPWARCPQRGSNIKSC